jgi:hypothetical protein
MEEYELPDALKNNLLYHLDFDSESATGKFGNAIKLNNKQHTEDDYSGPGTGSFSASFWINIAGIGSNEDDPILFTNKDWGSGGNPGYVFFVQNKDKPQLKFNASNGDGWRSDLYFDLPADYEGEWVHVICVVDRTKGTVRVAFNFGAFTEQQIGGHNAMQSYDAFALYIGCDKNGKYVIEQDTYMDDFMYFDRALTADDVISLEEYYLRLSTVLNITKNGTYDVSEYESAEVNVEPALQEKTVTKNGTVTPDEGYDGLSKVTVDVPGGAVEEYDGTVRDVEPTTLASSDGYMIADSNGLTIKMLGG